MRDAIRAALDHLKGLEFVDGANIAGLGWCFGGHPILELGTMHEKGVNCLISYHGVFDGVSNYQGTTADTIKTSAERNTQVLICNGNQDPFVPQDDIKKAKRLLESQGCEVNILNFDGVKHGFTNPAQDFNPSDAFAFNEQAAEDSWTLTIQLLRNTLSLT